MEYWTHPLSIPPGKVIINGDQVGTLAGKSIKIQRKGGGERFSLTCFLFSDFPRVKNQTCDKLGIEMPHPCSPSRSFSHCRKRFRQKTIYSFPIICPPAKFLRLLF